jgi:alcohol dehydrogenase
MKALVYQGPGKKAWKDVPPPRIQHPTDVIVRIDTTTICGTDLHILKGDVPAVTPGRVLGHEGVGVITEVGSSVAGLAVGDNVIISCIKSCGRCLFCKQGIFAHCLGDEGAVGTAGVRPPHRRHAGRAARAARRDFRLRLRSANQQGVLLSDIPPTGFEIGAMARPSLATVAVIGAGPIGLAVIMTAGLYGAAKIISIDLDSNRIAQARKFGATDGVSSADPDWKQKVMALTDGWGVDVAVEAVGIPATFEMATQIVRPGGHVANVGVHGKPVELRLNDLWIHNITISMGLAEHQHHTDAAAIARRRPARRRQVRQPPLQARRHARRLRHLWPGRRDEGAQGDHRTMKSTMPALFLGHGNPMNTDHPRPRRI